MSTCSSSSPSTTSSASRRAGSLFLATYLNGLGAGMAWRDALKTAFGMSIEAYYVNFAAYRAGL